MAGASQEHPQRKRRWFRFSLRTFLIATMLLGACLAYLGNLLFHVQQQRRIVARIQSLGGNVAYKDHYYWASTWEPPPKPTWWQILRYQCRDYLFTHVDYVNLGFRSPSSDDDLLMLATLPELQFLSVHGPGFTDNGMDSIVTFPKLETLNLADTKVTAHGIARLRGSRSLKSLTLYGSGVDDEILGAVKSLPHLEELQLIRTNVTSAGLEHLARLKNLRVLHFCEALLVADDGMPHLAGLMNLESFALLKTSVAEAGLEPLQGMTRMKSLDLRASPIGDEGLKHLAGMHELVELDLAGTQVGDAGLAHLKSLTDLRNLNLNETAVTDAGLKHLQPLQQLERVRMLWTAVTDEGLLNLASLSNLRSVEAGSKVTQPGALQLLKSLPESHISGTDVRGTRIFSVSN